jgi:hypothetical protein
VRARRCRMSSSEPSNGGLGDAQEGFLKSVQSAGISDLLPSGRIRTNCKPSGMRACRRTSRDCPSKG